LADFVPGLDLSRRFYEEVVRELVDRPHAAALVGEGSEILGYDQPRSTDHAWGPRVQIFVGGDETVRISQAVERALPDEYGGWPVRFFSWQTNDVRHHVEVSTLDSWLSRELGVLPSDDMSAATWLALPQQSLLQVTQGAVFRDDPGELTRIRKLLSWYPRDIWLWMMASQWHLIGNTEPLVGRTIEASDRRGSSLIVARLVRLLMELCFLQERRYWPYRKWFGTAFSRLQAASDVGPIFDTILSCGDASTQQDALAAALTLIAERHNALGVTPPVDPSLNMFHVGINDAVRPYRVLNAGRFSAACKEAIGDEGLRGLVTVGAIDQLTHSDDALVNFTDWPRLIEQDYRAMIEGAARGRR
jgi:Domain of unknown function (DUF4037)